MSTPYSFEHLADIRDGARRMLVRTRAHEGDLNHLVDMAEEIARQATALGVALTRTDTNAEGLRRLCSDQARLSVENTEATVRAWTSRCQCSMASRPRSHQGHSSNPGIESHCLHRKRLDPVAARELVRRRRVEAVAAGRCSRGRSERSQPVAIGHPVYSAALVWMRAGAMSGAMRRDENNAPR